MEGYELLIYRITKQHPNPTPIAQDIYDGAKPWEKPQIKEAAKKFGIKLVGEEKSDTNLK